MENQQVDMMENQQLSWPYFDPNYDTMSIRINPPRVVVDNVTCNYATLVKVAGANSNGVLLEIVQVLTDLDLCISKAYISSDGGWFMDVFHVIDQSNRKLTDEAKLESIERACIELMKSHSLGAVHQDDLMENTAIELKGMDRPGLLAEVSAVLTKLGCNVSHAEVWTHTARVACVIHVTEGTSGGPVCDPDKLQLIWQQLCALMGGEEGSRARISFKNTNAGRRLHQMMSSSDWDEVLDEGKRGYQGSENKLENKPVITIATCKEKGYSIVNVECSDRPKLLFDTVFTLTDLKFVFYHGTVHSEKGYAYQEYYVRDQHGGFLESEADKERVTMSLEAAIERRASDGLRLELLANDKIGLLSEVTSMFRENGLSVARADVKTRGNEAIIVSYVTDLKGNSVNPHIAEAIKKSMSPSATLNIKKIPRLSHSPPIKAVEKPKGFSIGSLFKSYSENSRLALVVK